MNEIIYENIVNQALENLQKNANLKGIWKNNDNNKTIDGQLTLLIDSQKLVFNIEIKKELRGNQLAQIEEIAGKNQHFMVIAHRIIPKFKDELRKRNIAYLEANGNIYLKEQGILLWIDANKLLPAVKARPERAFTKTGLKVIFNCLINDQFINRPYREIAQVTGVALGAVHNVVAGLRQIEFLIKLDKTRFKLINKKELINTWMPAYNAKLKPALLIGKFRFLKDQDFINWKKLKLTKDKTFWGGEPAGDLLTNYLRPVELTLYTTETRNEVIKSYRLIPDELGKVLVYKKFWNIDEENKNTVSPLLVYTDLMNTGDRRCIETAQKIYEQYLQNQF